MRSLSVAIAISGLFASGAVAQLPPIEIMGSKFFFSNNGSQFFMRGVAYQEDISSNGTTSGSNLFTDPLADPQKCSRDIPLLRELYTNTIRVYAIDPTADHDECMRMLDDAGIYVIADLSVPVPGQSINRDDPSWDEDLYARYTGVIDIMQKYDNTLGFFAGNEVSNQPNNTAASAFVKAAARDMKAYIKQRGYRTIGVGYAANDDPEIRIDLANYFDCGDPAEAIDFFGYNIYSWCGESTFQRSGFADRTKQFSTYNIPSFFAEYGCNTEGTRIFQEVGTLYGDQMTDVFSGGIVFMYFQEANNYGLVTIDGESASKMPDFENLQTQIASITGVTGINSASYTPTNRPAACPTRGFAASDLPPVPNRELCGCMERALSCNLDQGVETDDLGDLFGVVCGLSNTVCLGIRANGTTGDYGTYGMCNPRQKAGWALNAYFAEQTRAGNGASACDFSGSATLQSAVSPTGACRSQISVAGPQGTGIVTDLPTGSGGFSGGSGGSGGGGGGGGGSNASGSKNGVPGSRSPILNYGALQIGLYIFCAMGSGAAMILL